MRRMRTKLLVLLAGGLTALGAVTLPAKAANPTPPFTQCPAIGLDTSCRILIVINPGGTLAVPPLLSFSVTDGAGTAISTIPGGSNAFTQGTLSALTLSMVPGLSLYVPR